MKTLNQDQISELFECDMLEEGCYLPNEEFIQFEFSGWMHHHLSERHITCEQYNTFKYSGDAL